MMSGPASGITIWCASAARRAAGQGPGPPQALELRAAEWFAATGDSRQASRHFLAARQADRALALLEDRVVTEFLRDPALPPPLDLSMVDPALLADAPDRLLALAADLLLSGDMARGGEYVDLLERAQPPIEPVTAGGPVGGAAVRAPWADRADGRGRGRGPGRAGHPGADIAHR